MIRIGLAVLVLFGGFAPSQEPSFVAVDVFIDAGSHPLAAPARDRP